MAIIQSRRKAMLAGLLAILATCMSLTGLTQDTVRISLKTAEELFLNRNLVLLAEKYNIDAAKAQLLQARLWNNPTLSFSGNLYNPAENKIADVGNRSGQYVVDIQQVIRLAGKRKKEIGLAETAIGSSEDRFFDLIRTLRYTLRSNFFKAHYINASISSVDKQIYLLESLDTAYAGLQQRAVVTLKDALRIRSLLYTLKANKAGLFNELNDVLSEIKLLTSGTNSIAIPVVDEDALNGIDVRDLSLHNVIDSALANRYDLRLGQSLIEYNNRNYSLQKAYATPDLTVGAEFDKRGSFVNNATFLNLSVDLPFFKKNQGNIRAAQIGVTQSKVQYDQQKLAVVTEVQRAYGKLLTMEKLYTATDPSFLTQYEKLLNGIAGNFQHRNISLLEFTDFYESYNNNIQQINRLKSDRIQAMEELNFSVGKTLFNY